MVRNVCNSEIVWRGIGGPPGDINSKMPIVDRIAKMFETKSGMQFVRVQVRYPVIGKLSCHHIMNVELKDIIHTTDDNKKRVLEHKDDLSKRACRTPSASV